jgi:acyl-CoA synthetase (AMP-forming)/AMP-acid ligase II
MTDPRHAESFAAGPQTLCARLDVAASWDGAAPALLDGAGVRVTHADLLRVRAGGRLRLRAAGVGRHDRVAIVMSNDWQLAAVLLAAVSACGASTLDPALSDRELVAALTQLRVGAVIADAESAPRLRTLVDEGTPVLAWSADDLDGEPAGDSADGADGADAAPDDPALLLFTSGTTSAPRITGLTQRNIAAGSVSIARTLRLGPTDRALNMMSLYHGHGIFPGTFAPLVSGGSSVCARPNDADELLAVAVATAPTWYSAAPVVHHSVLAMARANPLIVAALPLRAIRSNSSALPVALLEELEQTFSAPVIEAYALSEAPGQVASNPLDGPRKPGTVGIPQDTELVVLTAAGVLTDEPGSSGEILVRGPIVMPGYVGVPDNEQPFLDGWLRTGDQAVIDEDGYLAIGGRVVDTINRGAEKFAPAEVEAVLAEHPAVREVAVFGRSHPTLGEEAAAAVVPCEGTHVTETELIEFAAQRLATYKVPVRIEFMPELPRGGTGKIVRRRLKETAARSTERAGLRTGPTR